MKKKLLSGVLLCCLVLFSCGFNVPLPALRVPQGSTLYDVHGQVIRGLAAPNQIIIPFEEIPDAFKQAVIATEDKNFYWHHGIDAGGIARAVLSDIKARKVVAGGSTITQQTAKTLFLTNERTFTRKLKELWYAILLEQRYSKDEILAMYCNSIYFGEGATGVEVAARMYFGKEARRLNQAEAILLAGIPNSPTAYDPYLHPEKAKARQQVVLDRMVAEGYLKTTESRELDNQPLNYQRAAVVEGDAPYFTAMVKDYLVSRYGEKAVFQDGLQVYTSLDLTLQAAASAAVKNGLKNQPAALQGAIVSLDVSTGQILAMVGGRSYTESSYNRVFATRQPGSTFKPFMYSLALGSGFTEANLVPCQEVEFPVRGQEPYRPQDYGDEPYHWRDFTLKEAVMVSDNVVAVQVNSWLGPARVARYAENFGFKNIRPVLSLPLGSSEVTPLQMAAGYATFANQGIYSEPYSVLKVVTADGRTLEENKPLQRRVIGADNAYIITDMLMGVMEPGGTGSHLKSIVGRTTAGKTGTTDDFKDAWFVGYTPGVCAAVWVGFDKNQSVKLTGGAIAGPIWANFMKSAAGSRPNTVFNQPANITRVSVCLDSGMLAVEACPRSIPMAFVTGTEPQELCPLHSHADGWEWFEDTDREQWSPRNQR